MPKAKVYVRGIKGGKNVAQSCKIGGRSSFKSVKTMSLADLMAASTSLNTRGRDKNKINNELARRAA